jgi:hypothetical protein
MSSPIPPVFRIGSHRPSGFERIGGEEVEDISSYTANTGVSRRHQTRPLAPEVNGRPKYFKLVSTALCLTEFARAIDAVILPVILPGIVSDLNANTSQGYLSGSAFLLCQTVSQPVWAGFSQGLGDQACMLAAFSAFAGASVLAGLAKTPEWLIGARAVRTEGARTLARWLANVRGCSCKAPALAVWT